VPFISLSGRKGGEEGKRTTSTSSCLIQRTPSRKRRSVQLRLSFGADVLISPSHLEKQSHALSRAVLLPATNGTEG
jgi:hypothetical protein